MVDLCMSVSIVPGAKQAGTSHQKGQAHKVSMALGIQGKAGKNPGAIARARKFWSWASENRSLVAQWAIKWN